MTRRPDRCRRRSTWSAWGWSWPQAQAGALIAFSGPRRRGIVAARLYHADLVGGRSARSSATSRRHGLAARDRDCLAGCGALLLWTLTRSCGRGRSSLISAVRTAGRSASCRCAGFRLDAAGAGLAAGTGAAAPARPSRAKAASRGPWPPCNPGRPATGTPWCAALMKRAPDFHRHAAAGGLLRRRIVVVAEPDAGDEMAGVADEPGVAEILRRAGLAGGRPAGQRRPCARCRSAASPASSRSSSPT